MSDGTEARLITRHISYRFRIYPTPTQERRLLAWQDALRFLWNLAHEQRLSGLERPSSERRYVSRFAQERDVTELRSALPWLADVPRGRWRSTCDAFEGKQDHGGPTMDRVPCLAGLPARR